MAEFKIGDEITWHGDQGATETGIVVAFDKDSNPVVNLYSEQANLTIAHHHPDTVLFGVAPNQLTLNKTKENVDNG